MYGDENKETLFSYFPLYIVYSVREKHNRFGKFVFRCRFNYVKRTSGIRHMKLSTAICFCLISQGYNFVVTATNNLRNSVYMLGKYDIIGACSANYEQT